MNIFGLISVVFGLVAIVTGAIVVRGFLRRTLSGHSIIRFLSYSLIASLGGMLPATHRLAPIQEISMLSVYCSGLVMVAWYRFHFVGIGRPVFAFLNTVILYLNVLSVLTWLSKNVHRFSTPAIQSLSVLQVMQFSFGVIFAALGILAARNVVLEPGRLARDHKIRAHILN